MVHFRIKKAYAFLPTMVLIYEDNNYVKNHIHFIWLKTYYEIQHYNILSQKWNLTHNNFLIKEHAEHYRNYLTTH